MHQKKIVVTGGLGFIGSHTIVCLHEAGYVPVIIDNLQNTNIEVLDAILKLVGYKPEYIKGDVNDKALMAQIFKTHQPEAVIHFAAHKYPSVQVHIL
jgi:UDP-glucose 4-epimerase